MDMIPTRPRAARPWLVLIALAFAALVLSACADDDAAQTDGDDDDVSAANGDETTGEEEEEAEAAVDDDADAGGEAVEISFVGTQPEELLVPVVEAFEAEHPDIQVRYEAVPFEEMSAVIAQRVGGGTGDIDVYYADAPRNPTIVNEGLARDLTDDIGDLSGVVPEQGIETATIDGRLWTVPVRTSTQVLYYNIDLLEQAGIEPPSMDPDERVTWEELRAMAEEAQAAGATYGYVDDQVSRYYQFQPLPESLGGGSGLEGDQGLEPDLTNDAWIEATQWWADLYEDGLAPRGVAPDETKPIFINGDAAFMPGGPWWIPDFAAEDDLNFGIAAFPYFEDGEVVTPTDSEHLAIDPNTEHPEEALELVRFIGMSQEGALAFGEGLAVPLANLEALPVQLGDLEDARPELEGFADLALYEVENTAVARPFSIGYVQFEEIIGPALEDIRGGADVEERLQQAESELEEAFSRLQ